MPIQTWYFYGNSDHFLNSLTNSALLMLVTISLTEKRSSSIYDVRHVTNTMNTTDEKSAKNNTVQGGTSSESTNVNKVSLVFVTASSANHMSALLLDNLPSIEKWLLNKTAPTFLPTLERKNAPTKADLSVHVIHYKANEVVVKCFKYFANEKYNITA